MHRLTILFLLCTILSVVMSINDKEPCNTPRCRMACPFGYKLGSDGCATCHCIESPCSEGDTPLKDHFCGQGANRRECPKTHNCVSAPDDSAAVCCPLKDRSL
jgi:hypothetical protein